MVEHLPGSKVSVVLCTYNGSIYLQKQLKSIAEQTLKPVELVVSDDASTDSTVELIKRFAKESPFPVRLYQNQRNTGVVANYSRAAALCDGDYVALCDQDDIWLPEKLYLTQGSMHAAEKQYGCSHPVLVHTDLTVINKMDWVIAPSFMKMRKIRHVGPEPVKRLLVQNFVTGCTIMANRALLREALPIPEAALMHDWWLALVSRQISPAL